MVKWQARGKLGHWGARGLDAMGFSIEFLWIGVHRPMSSTSRSWVFGETFFKMTYK